MLRSVLRGICILSRGSPPSTEVLEGVSDVAFSEADSVVKDDKISYVEFSQWIRNTPTAKQLLRAFGGNSRRKKS